MKVRFLEYRPVASWHWDIEEDVCSICHMPFDACCPDCKAPGDECPPVWGECSHHFHIHCIVKWLQNNQKHCPMCRREWRFKSGQ